MLCPYIEMILLLVPISHSITAIVGATEKCNNELCNHEAVCELMNGKPSCQCIGTKYFRGDFCKDQVNNCASNPCKNNAPCNNALGQAVCGPCATGYGGHLCNIKKSDLFTKLYLHHNRYGYYSTEQRLLLTVESLGGTAFLLELYADNYAIDVLKTDPIKPNKWRKSSDLPSLARQLGMRHYNNMPYRSGYFYVAMGRFWKTGLQTLRLKVSDADTFLPYVENVYTMQILPKDENCMPELELLHCANPFKPLLIDVGRYTMFKPVVRKRCSETSKMHFDWNVYNSIETVFLHSYGRTDEPRLKLPPYASWFRYKGEVIQVSMIHIGLTEVTEKEMLYTVCRCYVLVQKKSIVAKILGGSEREVDPSNSIRLDGSESHDLNYPPGSKAKLTYRWSCKSKNDPGNKYCNNLDKIDKVLFVPAGKLRQGSAYTFKLQVSSKANDYETDSVTQTLKLIDTKTLYVDIECVRNCESQKFTPHKSIHLMAVCLNCGMRDIENYDWSVENMNVANTKRFVTDEVADKPSITFQVRIISGSQTGSAAITLKRNNAPAGGSCKIEPKDGIEYETEFVISCENFEDDDLPIMFVYKTETFILDRTNDPIVKLRLPETNEIIVLICDAFSSCDERYIRVSVTALAIPDDLRLFLTQESTNLRKILEKNDFQRAMILALKVSKNVNDDVIEFICQQLNHRELYSLLEIEQFIRVVINLFTTLEPLTHIAAGALAITMEQLAHGFDNILLDGEVRETELMAYTKMFNDIASMLSYVSNEAEVLPEVYTPQQDTVNSFDRINEKYANFSELDPEVLLRVNNWLKCSIQLNKNIDNIGLVAANVLRPAEPEVIINKMQQTCEHSIIDNAIDQTVTKNEVTIKISTLVVQELQAHHKTQETLRQVISTPKNPFWWYPDSNGIDTGVIYLSNFHPKMTPGTSTDVNLKNAFEFTLVLKNESQSRLNEQKLSFGRLISRLDMNVFRIIVPVNTLLVIKFISTDIKLQVELTFDGTPTGYTVMKSKNFIFPTKLPRILMILNTREFNADAYLGVLPAEPFGDEYAYFTFIPELRKCLRWNFRTKVPHWTTIGCQPNAEESLEKGLRCFCTHMSTFAGKVYSAPAYSLWGVGKLLEVIPVNWYLVAYQLILAFVFFCWIVIAYFCLDSNRERLVTAPKDPLAIMQTDKNDEVILRITTGGQRNASTTAGIMVMINTVIGPQKFKIYQNPQRPHLKRNSTCTVRLPLSPQLLQEPITVVIKQDGGGRYPTWYCRSTEINYTGAMQPIMLKVNHWIAEKAIQVSESANAQHLTAKFSSPTNAKVREFGDNLETLFINWFQFQPLFGPWKFGNQTCNRFERTFIWLIKTALSLLLVSCFFGWTTLANYEEERQRYHRIGTDLLSLFILSIVCFIVGWAVQFAIEYWMLRISKKEYGITV